MVSDSVTLIESAGLTRVAPLEDEELLGAVQRGLVELIVPELERMGAEEFVVSQTRSLISIVGFVSRGLYDRQRARAACAAAMAALADPAGTDRDAALKLLRDRLDADIAGRIRR